MKKLLIIIFFSFFIFNNSFSKILVLECKNNNDNNSIILHLDTAKNHWLQANTRKFEIPQVGLVYESKFFLAAEVMMTPKDTLYWNNQYNDNAKYSHTMTFFDIDRYTGRFKMHSQILDQSGFNKYYKKLMSLKGQTNIYIGLYNFAEKSQKPGYRLEDFGGGTCSSSDKQF
ncbi:hypothetical protein N9394_01675 [Candidatus Pelagibacter sp.]|nr:hypothetical protein [Candidatus Pelagibacter sp.]